VVHARSRIVLLRASPERLRRIAMKCQYRGLTKDGEWVYGWYAERRDSHYNTYSVIIEDDLEFEVIPETLGQQTGLKDKNGKEIYEGDIVSRNPQPDWNEKSEYSNAQVVFNKGTYELTCLGCDEKKKFGKCIHSWFFHTYIIEVIGDIHTTPELMEKK